MNLRCHFKDITKGYTKHYYAGSERVASKLGGGGITNITTPIIDVTAKRNAWQTPYANLWHSSLIAAPPCSTYFYSLLNAQTVQNPEPERYFYHSDHLGSASWITDSSGKAIQHLQYLPFGETRIDQRATGSNWSTRYSFSAKEKDEESGYGYFGARYYDSDLSIWLSVDPMASKYPGLTPYNYCANNPIKLVDPNGKEVINAYAKDKEAAETRQQNAQASFDAFGGNKKAEGYKAAKAELTNANRNLRSVARNYNLVQHTINNVKKFGGDLFDKMDNLKDENGNTVDIHVSLKDLGSKRAGQVIENHDGVGFVNNKIDIELNPNIFGGGFLGETLAHEGGHAIYDIPNWSKNIAWQKENKYDYDEYDGHGGKGTSNYDPSGASADKYEGIYKNNARLKP